MWGGGKHLKERTVVQQENGLSNALLRGLVSPGPRLLATGRAGSQRSVSGLKVSVRVPGAC